MAQDAPPQSCPPPEHDRLLRYEELCRTEAISNRLHQSGRAVSIQWTGLLDSPIFTSVEASPIRLSLLVSTVRSFQFFWHSRLGRIFFVLFDLVIHVCPQVSCSCTAVSIQWTGLLDSNISQLAHAQYCYNWILPTCQ